MLHLFLKWLINALALIGVSYLLPGISVDSFYVALILALVLGVLNVLFKPIILLFTLPINIMTLGLFTFVVNGFIFWLASTFIRGFDIATFWSAILGALIFSIFSYVGNKLLVEKSEEDK